MINYLSHFISILAVILSIIATIHVFKITNEEMKDKFRKKVKVHQENLGEQE